MWSELVGRDELEGMGWLGKLFRLIQGKSIALISSHSLGYICMRIEKGHKKFRES